MDRHELTVEDLEAEQAVELPARDAMALVNLNVATVVAVNVPIALNVLSPGANATAIGLNLVGISQQIV